MSRNVVEVALKGIAMAMGVAVIVLGTLGTLDLENAVAMLGFGLTALALASFQN